MLGRTIHCKGIIRGAKQPGREGQIDGHSYDGQAGFKVHQGRAGWLARDLVELEEPARNWQLLRRERPLAGRRVTIWRLARLTSRVRPVNGT